MLKISNQLFMTSCGVITSPSGSTRTNDQNIDGYAMCLNGITGQVGQLFQIIR
jgi:hypothetical protein